MERGTSTYKAISVLLRAVCLCFFLSACSENNHAETGKETAFINFDVIEKEYLDTVKELNQPKDYSLPTRLKGREEIQEFQAGWGVTWASRLWERTWMKEQLKSYRTDAKRADAAIKELEKAFKMPYMNQPACDDTTRRLFKDRVDRAKLGDPSGFEESVGLRDSE